MSLWLWIGAGVLFVLSMLLVIGMCMAARYGDELNKQVRDSRDETQQKP